MTRHDLYSHLSHVMIQNYSKVQGVKDSIVCAKRKKKIKKNGEKFNVQDLIQIDKNKS